VIVIDTSGLPLAAARRIAGNSDVLVGQLGRLELIAEVAAEAADAFADALEDVDIKVADDQHAVSVPSGAIPVASVRSATVARIVEEMLVRSDNEAAEVLSRQVARAEGRPASFAGGASAVRAVLDRLGIDTAGDRIYDGSGLSREDRLSPGTLLAVLEAASDADRPHLRTVVAGLPVAGFTGSLTYRFDEGDPQGLGTVRAKTGTLTGVHGLAGVATSRDGAVMAFAFVADRAGPTAEAETALDDLAARLAGCGCG